MYKIPRSLNLYIIHSTRPPLACPLRSTTSFCPRIVSTILPKPLLFFRRWRLNLPSLVYYVIPTILCCDKLLFENCLILYFCMCAFLCFHKYIHACTYIIYIHIDVLCRQTSGRFGLLFDCLHDWRQGELGHVRRVWRRPGKWLQSIVRLQEPSRLDIAVGSDGWKVYWDRHYHEVSLWK